MRRATTSDVDVEIVDSQVHLNRLGPRWRERGLEDVLAVGLVAMDAVGVDAVVIDERWGVEIRTDDRFVNRLPNGAIRYSFPLSELAVARHPGRFGFVGRVDRHDPELEPVMADQFDRPGCVGMRIDLAPQIGELQPFLDDAYDSCFATAERLCVPVFVRMTASPDLLLPMLKRFPDLRLILDHSGSASPAPPTWGERMSNLDRVVAMAECPNLALKWCKAPTRVSMQLYPHGDLISVLRRVIDAFGAERVMWASDASQTTSQHSWAESLYHLRHADSIDADETARILGRSARSFLRWPAVAPAPASPTVSVQRE